MSYVIEKGVPLPQIEGRGNFDRVGQSKYPFAEMEIGDSFVPEIYEGETVAAALKRIRAAAAQWRQRKDKEKRFGFAVRKLTEDGKVVIRVWKTTYNKSGVPPDVNSFF